MAFVEVLELLWWIHLMLLSHLGDDAVLWWTYLPTFRDRSYVHLQGTGEEKDLNVIMEGLGYLSLLYKKFFL
jgi:hypothetical protein